MLHPRARIRHAVRDLLDGATAAGGRVHATRVVPYRRADLPAISVYTLEESADPDSRLTAPRKLTRDVSLVIEGWVAPGDNVDDAMDALALEIERAMHADPYLGDSAADSLLDSTSLEALEQGDRLMGLVLMTYQVTYRTYAPEAPEDLDDFITVASANTLGGTVDESAAAQDVFTVQEDE
jgi:hypothetical protein